MPAGAPVDGADYAGGDLLDRVHIIARAALEHRNAAVVGHRYDHAPVALFVESHRSGGGFMRQHHDRDRSGIGLHDQMRHLMTTE